MPTTQPPGTVETLVTLPDGSTYTRTWGPAGSYVEAWTWASSNPTGQALQAAGRLANVVGPLNAMATQAANTTVTAGNTVAVLQTVVNDLGQFCARLADLIQALGVGS